MGYKEKLGEEQLRVFQRMTAGENIFLTGNAGTGKSFLVEAFTEWCEENNVNILKAAPTGIAACNINGVTLHKLFRLPTDIISLLAQKAELNSTLQDTFMNSDIILIDEISMVRIDIFDKIMMYLEKANQMRKNVRKKELQIILVGDFYQLAPVITPADKEVLNKYYGTDIGNGYAFQSKYWHMFNIQFEMLTEVKRQEGDKEFCNALDQCKTGKVSCLRFFTTQTAKSELENAVWVCGKNKTASDINTKRLSEIAGKEKHNEALYIGECSVKDNLCEQDFCYKKGARVIMLVNDSKGNYQNGSMGTIKKISKDGIYVTIDSRDTDEDIKKPKEVLVTPYEFKKYEYTTKEVKQKSKNEQGEAVTTNQKKLVLTEIGKAVQYPMKLGYAVTVHKAQGQTYDRMNVIPEIFQEGQLYVALSRCRTAEKIFISGFLSNRMVKAANEVIKYYNNPQDYTFFGKKNDLVNVKVTKDCEYAVQMLSKLFGSHSKEITDFLNGLAQQEGLYDEIIEYIPEEEKPAPCSIADEWREWGKREKNIKTTSAANPQLFEQLSFDNS